MQCPGASALEDYLSGTDTSPARAAIDHHLDGCADCRRTVALLAPALPRSDDGDGLEAVHESLGAMSAISALAGGRLQLHGSATSPLAGSSDGGVELPGRRVSRYVLGERLGVGAMGVVYAAADPELRRNVAVKLMRGAWVRSGGAAARARVIREARALARISHPNVIAVHDVGMLGDEVFIAMELVRGANLTAYLRDARPSVAHILEVFTAAGQGLAAAHQAGVVHRDFKPDNVLVGDDGRVRVTDFGLALAAAADVDVAPQADAGERGAVDRTDAGALVGTPAYMAPEQHAGAHVDPRSDQFSFCVALYEALHGERPFQGESREQVARNAQEGRIAPRPPQSRVPGSLRAILLRGLAPDPADRFPSMPALLHALGRDRGRAPRRAAAAAAVALALVLVALGSDWIVRGRAAAATLASFAAARAQTSRLFQLRNETFAATADLSFIMPILREVAAVQDQADFGLGDEASDRATLDDLHQNLASADWVTWLRAAQDADVAVADYKGRLLYASAAPDVWARNVLAMAPIRAIYASGSDEVRIAVVRGDDPSVIAAGLLGGVARPGLRLLFTRLTVLDGRPRALFAQLVPVERLLSEIAPGEDTLVSMVALDGTAQGSVAPAVVAAGLDSRDIDEVEVAGEPWLVQHHPIASPGAGSPIAFLVLAHPAEMGLAGLFPGARTVLSVLAMLLAIIGVAGVLLARERNLSRREPRARRKGRARR